MLPHKSPPFQAFDLVNCIYKALMRGPDDVRKDTRVLTGRPLAAEITHCTFKIIDWLVTG